jgi:predicted DNA-binding transcriptional regulator YafY
VWIRYQSWQSEQTERIVDLYGLVYRSGFWYAVGYCHLRQALRVFRLDRVLYTRILDETFLRPEGFDSVGHVSRSIAMTPATWSVDVLLETTLEEAQGSVPSTLAALEQADGGVVLHCNVEDLDWIARFLAGLGHSFIVRQPTELREALQRLAQEIARMAERSGEDLS